MKDYLSAIQSRRSIYGMKKESPIPDSRIRSLIEEALLHTPSAYNMQSGRAVLLLGQQHALFWDIVMDTLREIVSADRFQPTEEKIRSFAAGYGTVLFFDDRKVVDEYARRYPLYRERFPEFALESNGILQYNVWVLLEEEGLGASLQHYNPLIDDRIREIFQFPEDWLLLAQMPFGSIAAPPAEKDFIPLEKRFLVLE